MVTPSASTSTWADQAREKIVRHSAAAAWGGVVAGRLILEARGRLQPGEWEPWLASLPFSRRTAYRLLRVGVVFGEHGRSVCERFELTALYDLAAPSSSPAAREAALAIAAKGEAVTAELAEDLIAEHRPPDNPETPGRFGGRTDVPEQVRQAAEVVRSAMIDKLDKAYCDGALGAVLWRDSTNAELRRQGLSVFQKLCVALFPEAFDEPSTAHSLCPPAGPQRAGDERLVLFAEHIAGKRPGPSVRVRAG